MSIKLLIKYLNQTEIIVDTSNSNKYYRFKCNTYGLEATAGVTEIMKETRSPRKKQFMNHGKMKKSKIQY